MAIKRLLFVCLHVAVFLFVCSAVAEAARIRVPGDAPTVQEAVATAADGDVIAVSRGTPPEDVLVQYKQGLTIVGKGKPTMKSFRILNCQRIELSGFLIEDSTEGNGIYMYDSITVRIRKCTVRNVMKDGIQAENCFEVTLEKCVVSDTDRDGIRMGRSPTGWGSDSAVIKCRVSRVPGYGIVNYGNRNRIQKCKISDTGSQGISWTGSADILVSRNRLTNIGTDGLFAAGDNGRIEKNRVTGCGGAGCCLDNGTGSVVAKNRITSTETFGLVVQATAPQTELQDNTISSAGSTGVQIEGSEVVATGNKVRGSGLHGVRVLSGSGCVLTRNTVKKSSACGFLVESSGNTLTRNVARNSGDVDLRDSAGGNSYGRNKFGTTNMP